MAASGSPGRRVLSSVRFRVVAVALLAVGVTFAIGGFALEWQLQRSAVSTVVDLTVSEAGDVGALLVRGNMPHRLTATHPGTDIQVVNADHHVLSTTADLAGRPPLSLVLPRPGAEVRFDGHTAFPSDDDLDVGVALGVRTPHGARVVYVVATTEQAEETAHDSVLPLIAVLFGLLVATGIVAWFLTGRALRPVERIRAQVAGISGGDLHRRVEEPPVDDEVGRLARTMNAMLGRIESASDRQAQFVADASHELRSPLTALLTELEVARLHPEAAKWPAVASTAIDDGLRLQRIIDDLLLLARSDEDHLVPRREQVDLDELALTEGDRLRSRGKVSVDLRAVGAARITGDRELLGRLLRNLVENAERHASGAVRLEVATTAQWAEIAVADDGPGIPIDKREWVFERFARLDDGRGRRSGGTGLGLAIVGEIARAHHGTVRVVDSAVGTRMVVRLPVVEDAMSMPDDPPRVTTAGPTASPSGAARDMNGEVEDKVDDQANDKVDDPADDLASLPLRPS